MTKPAERTVRFVTGGDGAAAQAIRTHESDNVAVAAGERGLQEGTALEGGVRVAGHIPLGHKVALADLREGDPVLRYGVVIGYAKEVIPAGGWVRNESLRIPDAPDLADLPMATLKPEIGPPLEGRTFMGYRNADGSVGTRNLLGITTTVQCVSGVVEHAARRIREELLPRHPQVDGVVALDHIYGCGVAIDAPEAVIPIRTLRNISRSPNFGGELLTVSLGCEKLQPGRLFDDGEDTGLVRLQDAGSDGFASMVAAIMERAEERLGRLAKRQREPVPLSELSVGLQCGGSDALSGITANPAVGHASDLLVRAGATSMFSEITEVRDAIGQLTARAVSREVAEELIEQIAWYDRYLEKGGVDRSANTTPGNRAGGLANIVEKALGSVCKSGSAPLAAVVAPGERAQCRGLLFNAGPANDFICGTLQLAAGATVHVFTTGRGTPYSLAALPTIKVSTNSGLAERWHDLIDVDAGPIANGDAGIEEIGELILERIIEVAGGEATCAERNRIHNSLALFNPAPLT